MFIHKYVRQEFWTIMLVILYLLATLLLPATPLAAADGEAPCGESGAPSAIVAAAPVPAPDQPVKIPKEEIDRATFEAVWLHNYQAANRVLGLYGIMVGNQAPEELLDEKYDIVWDLLDLKLTELLENTRVDDTSPFAYDDLLQKAIDLTLNIPELAPLVPKVWKDLADVNGTDSIYYSYYGDVAAKVSTSAWRYSNAARMLASSSDILQRAYGCAKVDPKYAEAFNEHFSEKLNVGITDDAMEILEKNLSVGFPEELRGRIAADGTITVSLNELKKFTETEFGKLHNTLDGIQNSLVEIDQQQKVIVDYLQNEQLKAKQQEIAKKKAAEYQLKIDAAKASVSILSTIVGQIDKNLGKDISTIGASTIQIVDSLNGWLKATAGLKGLEKASSLSTVIMTGNVLGAVMNIVALFGEDKPSPEQLILKEIDKLRQQVSQLRTQMHSRFDRVDAGLNAIYTSMHDRFNLIDVQLGRINGNILDIQQTLLSLDLKLSQIERNNFELINAVGRRELLTAINLGLDYEENTGLEMPYEPEFIEFANLLHAWGTIHAYDPGNAGPTQRDMSDGKLYEELTKYPLDLNLNYLNSWLIAHGLPALTDKYLASSRDWLFASRAYTQLGIEQPDHMSRIGEGRQEKLDQVGFEIDSAIQNISTRQTANGPIGNTLLFSSVITYYQDKFGPLNNAITQIENNFVSEIQANHLQRAEPFNLYGGTAQTLSYVTPEISAMTCGNSPNYGPLPISSNLRALIPNFELYNLAEYLRVGSFAACVSDEWGEIFLTPVDNPERPWDPPINYWDAEQHKSILTIYFDGVPLVRQTFDEGYTRMDIYLPEIWTQSNWLGVNPYKEKFDALTTADPLTPEMMAQQEVLRQTVTNKIETALAGYQKGLYQRVIQEVTTGSLKDMAVEAGGGKALLAAFTTLGLSRAVAEDEFLHALLYGDQQLVDHNSIVQSYAVSLTNPIAGSNLLINPRQIFMEAANKRTAAFAKIVGEYLNAITAETHVEAADFIVNTRRALDMTMLFAAVVAAEAPETPTPPVTPTPETPTPETPPVTPTPATPVPPNSVDGNAIYLPSVAR